MKTKLTNRKNARNFLKRIAKTIKSKKREKAKKNNGLCSVSKLSKKKNIKKKTTLINLNVVKIIKVNDEYRKT